ncbi:MAG: TolC family protein, partial [Vulcanimicrobiaceae bacterium]
MRELPYAAGRTLTAALAFALVLTAAARAQTAQPVILPTPAPLPSPGATPIPYPAYGTPAPDVVQLVPHKGVPPQVSLQQAVALAVVLSPAFATERAQYDAIRAKYGAEQSALFPSVEIVASATRLYGFQVNNTGTGSSTGASNPTELKADALLQQLIYDGGRVIAAIKSARS